MWINTESFETPQRGLTYNAEVIIWLDEEQEKFIIDGRIPREKLRPEQLKKLQEDIAFEYDRQKLWHLVSEDVFRLL